MAEDRSKQSLILYKKDGTKVATGEAGAKSVSLTGIAAGTKAAAGDYQVAFTDGTNTSEKVSAPAFEVPAAVVAVTGVTLSQKTATMKVGDTKIVTATITPENATNKEIVCSSDDESIATFGADGKITAIAVGTANVTVTTKDGNFTASCAVTVTEAA